jgi:hypothetical protein
MICLVLYIFISAFNARGYFNLDTKEYTYFSTFNINLPHSYDSNKTYKMLWQYLGLIFIYFGVKCWIHKDKYNLCSIRTKKLLYVIIINGGILAFVSILQRMHYGDGNGNLLFLITPTINSENLSNFGPFAYRSNAATYYNMIWPIAIGFFYIEQKSKKTIFTHNKSIILIPFIILLTISPWLTTSRGGILVFLFLCAVTTIAMLLLKINRKVIIIGVMIAFSILTLSEIALGKDFLMNRIETTFKIGIGDRRIELLNTVAYMLKDYVFSDTSPSPYGSGPGTFQTIIQFEIGENLKFWESWAHCDYLEILLTFGIYGSGIISVIIITLFVDCIINLKRNKQDRIITIFMIISIIGVMFHAALDFPLQVHSILIMISLIVGMIPYKISKQNIN